MRIQLIISTSIQAHYVRILPSSSLLTDSVTCHFPERFVFATRPDLGPPSHILKGTRADDEILSSFQNSLPPSVSWHEEAEG